MALSFPLALPSAGFDSNRFEPRRMDFLAPEMSGRVGAMGGGWPLWEAEYQLGGMTEETADEITAFKDALRGPQRLFYGRDLKRPFPRAYPDGFAGMARAGGGSFAAGTASTWSVNGARDVLTLTGLPANFVISKRDYVGFSWTTGGQQRRHLVRAVEAVQANGSGVAVVTVEPAVHAVVPSGATAVLANPDCLMRLTPETRLGAVDLTGSVSGVIQAVQVILP